MTIENEAERALSKNMSDQCSLPHPATLGVVLAGGLARRMGGGDKALIAIGGVSILDRVLERLRPTCQGIILNANGDPARFARYGLPVICDSVPDFAGPLAGILAGLDWVAANVPDIAWVVSTAGDCPFLPQDLVTRLHEARQKAGTPLACARSGDWRHPVVALWPVALREDLRHALAKEGLRKIEVWTARHGIAIAEWPAKPLDPFFNVNTPEDADEAERLAQDEAKL
jgi:molybdenum cofactor guanylyltransferase